jgi:hypothetical protein
MNVATHATEMNGSEDYSWVLQELNDQTTEMSMVKTLESKVKIFDAAGNLVREILKADFEENAMENSEYKVIAKSVFMFEYLGDSYFLLEK